ncbi:hypothetical protein AB2C55_33065, partial [Pseudomonas aeruginosa]
KRTYHYAWKGGPRVEGELGTPEFVTNYNAAVAGRTKPLEGTLLSVLNEFQASGAFRGLADVTRKDYARHIRNIEREFGDFPLAGL